MKPMEIAPLTGLRGVAALAVVASHANYIPIQDRFDWPQLYWFRGQPFVDIFFILSGFVLTYVYLNGQGPGVSWGAFFKARFARIFPLHLATAAAAAAGLVALGLKGGGGWPAEVSLGHAWRELTLTMALPLLYDGSIWNSPAWSISVEWWTYILVFPILAMAGHRLSPPIALLTTLTLLALVVLFVALTPGSKPTREWEALARAAAGFAAGWAVCRYHMWKPDRLLSAGVVDFLWVMVLAMIFVTPRFTGAEAWFVLTLLPLAIHGLLNPKSWASRLLSLKPVVYLGAISYSVYLVHPLVFKVVSLGAAGFDDVGVRIGILMACGLTVVPLIAAASYHLFELPARDWIRRLRFAPPPRPLTTGG